MTSYFLFIIVALVLIGVFVGNLVNTMSAAAQAIGS